MLLSVWALTKIQSKYVLIYKNLILYFNSLVRLQKTANAFKYFIFIANGKQIALLGKSATERCCKSCEGTIYILLDKTKINPWGIVV